MNRVLVIAYFFPPVNSMGSHHVLRLVQHLQDYGWQPVVLTGATMGWRERDERLLAKVPATVEVHRARGLDLTEIWVRYSGSRRSASGGSRPAPLKTQGLTTWLNRWVMIPDKYFPWIRPATALGEQLLEDAKINAIFSTSDPLSDHLVGQRLARRSGLPWVAEFRDLWLGSPYFARNQPTAVHRALHARLERRIVKGASAIVTLSRGIEDYFATIYPFRRSQLIHNCYDPADYPLDGRKPSKFTVVYAGALYSSRSPETFLTGFAKFIRQNRLTSADVEFVWLGLSPDLDVAAMVGRLGLTEFVEQRGQVGHAAVLQAMCSATVLLTIQSPVDNVHVPGKLFEYIGARRPILALAYPGEVASIVHDNKLGWVAAPEVDSVAARLGEAYQAWKTKGHDGLAITAANRFSVQEIVRQLAGVLDSVRATR
jgi:glycosyltransferase involved in cell wall biosynthesis